jgi:chromosome condensin MukBEF MukE localization factor
VKGILWFGLGIAAGVAASRKARSAAHRITPAGAAENVGDGIRELAAAVGSFGAEVRAGMVQREAELHSTVAQRTGMDIGSTSTSGRASAAVRA